MHKAKLISLAAAMLLGSVVTAGVAVAEPAESGAADAPAGAGSAERRPSAMRMNFALEQPILSGKPGPQPYVVRLFSDPVLGYTGGVPGLRATVGANAAPDVSASSPDAVRYAQHLQGVQAQIVEEAGQSVGRALAPISSMTYGDNMVVLELTRGEAVSISKVPGVIAVSPLPDHEPNTDTSLDTIDALDLWTVDPDGGGALTETKGDGMVIGVIDTGVSPYNPSFAPSPGQDNALGDGTYLGVCAEDNWDLGWGPFPCNDKLVGMYSWPLTGDGSGIDTPGFDLDGHGSHTASTAGGAAVTVDPYGQNLDISGVAPNASLVMYGGCCFSGGLDLAAALDQAAADSFSGLIDVINYSVGSSGAGDPWDNIGALPIGGSFFGWDTVAFFYIRYAADTFVATSNGNDGPGYYTTGSPASAPWVTSVGASATSRYWTTELTLPMNSAGAFVKSATAASDTVTAELVRADADDLLCEDTTGHEAAYAGKIVFCDRGAIAFVEKAANVAAQGAVGFVVQNSTTPDDPVPVTFPIPGLYISGADGADVIAWLAGDGDHEATISSTLEIDATREDGIADFSSRGPNLGADIINPSVTAPGVDILAALADPDDETNPVWGAISGTSMASPHVAGSAALLRQLHPDWTAAQIQSALMTTASPTVHDLAPGNADIADVDTQGSGRINVNRAANAGLLFDIDPVDFYVEDPNFGGDPKLLNLPSFADYACVQQCTWDRVASVVTDGVVWTVDPDQEELPGLEVDVTLDDSTAGVLGIQVTADVTAMAVDDWAQARITLVPGWAVPSADPLPPEVTMPLAVVAALADVPDSVELSTRRDVGSTTFDAVSVPVAEFESAVYGLAAADVYSAELTGDPTSGDAFDDLSQVDVYTFEVPAGADRAVVELLAADMADADIFVGEGDTPSDATMVALSASSGNNEFINIDLPDPGTYWVVVQNWEASDQTFTTPDAYRVAIGVVPGEDLGNLTVTGPAAGATSYPVGLEYDITGAEPGSVWYGTLSLGGGIGAADEFGYVQVTIYREDDDVTKTASVAEAEAGDVIGYTIAIAGDVTGLDTVYSITDTVPAGLTIDAASVTGGGVVAGQTITWEVPLAALGDPVELTYSVTVAADAASGTYTNAVVHSTDDPSSVEVTTTADVEVVGDLPPAPSMIEPVPPKRLFDTRPTEPQGAITVDQHTYGGDDVLQVNLLGIAGIGAADVAAVALNVTAVDPEGPGYVTVYPCGEDRPLVSSINYMGVGAYPNAVIAPLSDDGDLCLYSKVQTHLIADVVGWFPDGGGIGTVAPDRLFDTRTTEPQGSIVVTKAPIGGEGNILRVKVAGVSGVPETGAAAVSLNVTAVDPAGEGYVTVYPCNDDRPFVSNVNYAGPGAFPNAVITPVSPDGEVCFYSKVDTDLIADVNAWFPAGGDFGALTPARLFDTRTTDPAGAIEVEKQQYGGDANILMVKVTGVAGIPEDGVGIVSLNVTAVNPTGPGYVTVYPCGPRPLVSNINFMGPGVYPNAVLTPVSETGEVCFFSKVPTDLIADVNGWFAAP